MEIIVNEEKQRLDKYIANNTSFSRSLILKMIDSDYIKVNSKKVKGSYLVKKNDLIEIKDGYIKPLNLEGTNIPLDIVYEDDDIMVINKQSGLVVHPGNGNKENTLVNALIYYNKTLSNIDELRPGIVHRLDKDTSGLMLVAKSNKAHEILSNDFKNKLVKREYIALLDGVFPHQTATIDAPIGRDDNRREVMTIKTKNSKTAITHLTVIKKYQENTLVSLILDTGRTHQIRVHMKYIGYPVHNDPVYNDKKSSEFGQFLHSAKIDFIHPVTKKKMHFECQLPEIFQNYIDALE